ncbi:MAG TPA: aldehyde dehydrogenase, partial [Blastocatellia bacterium]|nr:aldehyde dehydrogenase [Blastocatellia bacterium]
MAKSLRLISEGIAARREEFARTIALESGKPLTLARGEAERAAASFAWAAGEAERFTGEIIPVDTQAVGRGKTAWTLRVPRGIIYGITPFNFPLNLVAHKVAPALAARNSIVIKPSPRTPLTALLLGEVFLESGLPKSALQIAPMDVKYIGEVFSDDRISMISFTGSASVGWEIKRLASKKFTALELGGNAAVIVDKSANFERSVSRSVTGAFAYSGQVCISVQRIYVHEKLFDDWLADFARRSHELIFGDPLDETTQISAMIDESAAIRAEEWIKEAIGNGAKLVSGGKRSGAIMEPSILTNTTPEMRVVSEEVFAPVAVVERFSEFA